MTEFRALLDLRGLTLHSYYTNVDPDGGRAADGTKLATPGHTIINFLDRYLLPIAEQHRLNEIIAVKDAGNHIRRAIYPDYKAKPDADPEVAEAIQASQAAVDELLKCLGIPSVLCPETEADDVIAFLVGKLPGPVIVHTVDNDLLQLASDRCAVFVKQEPKAVYTPKEGLDVQPQHIALYKSLCGDSSDNYKGVPGFGPAKFKFLQETYGLDGLDELCEIVQMHRFSKLDEAIAETGCKVLSLIRDNRHEWITGWQLARLRPEAVEAKRANSRFHRLQWTKRVPNRARLVALLSGIHCLDLLPKLEQFMPQQWILDDDGSDLDENIAEAAKAFAQGPIVALDWETTDTLQHPAFKEAVRGREYVDMLSSEIVGAGFTFGRNYEHTFYSTYGHKDSRNLPTDFLVKLCQAIPEGMPIACHNSMFEVTVMARHLGYILPEVHDTRTMSSHVDENERHHLKDLSKRWLNYDQTRYRDVIEQGKTMSDYSVEHVFQYGADDPLVTAHLYDLFKLILQIEGTWEFCRREYFPTVYPLSEAYIAGVSIDDEEMARQHAEDSAKYEEQMARLRQLIKANQTPESIESGTRRVIEERLAEFQGRKRRSLEKKGLPEDAVRAEITKLTETFKQETREAVIYRDFELVPVPIEAIPTPAKISKILEAHGLPPFTSAKPSDVLVYVRENKERCAGRVQEFLLTVSKACSEFAPSKRKGREYEEFAALFAELSRELLAEKTMKVGSELNLDSPPQNQILLYGMLDLPIRIRQFEQSQTREDLEIEDLAAQANKDAVATALAEDAPEGSWKREALLSLREARECFTRLKMFYRVYPLWKHPADGQIHPQLTLPGTETRRPTGSSPNALQWPKRGEGKKFRRNIKPNAKLGHDLVGSIDWNQQELRVAAALSMDPVLLDCYIGSDVIEAISAEVRALLGEELYQKLTRTPSKDVHGQTATGLLKQAYDVIMAAVKDPQHPLHKAASQARTSAKPINFGSTYGIGAAKVARQLLLPAEECKVYLQDKKALYAGFEVWRESTIALARQQGYIATQFGSRRHVFNDIDGEFASSCERQLVNFCIQGVCADVLAKTLSELHRRRTFQRYGAVLVAPIYDEVVFSFHSSVAVPLIQEVHSIMTRDIPGFAVPMLAEPSVGVNFADQVEIGWRADRDSILKAVGVALNPEQKKAA